MLLQRLFDWFARLGTGVKPAPKAPAVIHQEHLVILDGTGPKVDRDALIDVVKQYNDLKPAEARALVDSLLNGYVISFIQKTPSAAANFVIAAKRCGALGSTRPAWWVQEKRGND